MYCWNINNFLDYESSLSVFLRKFHNMPLRYKYVNFKNFLFLLGVYVCMCMQRTEVNIKCLPWSLDTLFFDSNLSLNYLARPAVPWAWNIHFQFLFPQFWDHKRATMPGSLHGHWESNSCPYQALFIKCFIKPWAIFPTHANFFKIQ